MVNWEPTGGASARVIFDRMKEGEDLYCFDTFEGFVEEDVSTESIQNTGVQTKAGHFGDTSIVEVESYITKSGKNGRKLHLRKGYFPNTFEGLDGIKWKFVHLDADLYAPMKSGIEKFWPNLQAGGVMLLHDYNSGYQGTRKATDEYFGSLGIKPIPMYDKAGSVVVIKS